MRIQSRREILDIWHAMSDVVFDQRKWWWGEPADSDSITEAEQLLCLLTPATEVAALRIAQPDDTSEDVLMALNRLGDSVQIPRTLLFALEDYLGRHTGPDGTPQFSAHAHLVNPALDPRRGSEYLTPGQLELGTVDAFAVAVRLMLAALSFLAVYEFAVRGSLVARIAEMRERLSQRLTAAMVGLLRSFTVDVFAPDSADERALLGALNSRGLPLRIVRQTFAESIADVRASLRETREVDNPNFLFECGWTWGVAQDASKVFLTESQVSQPPGVAASRPSLYHTFAAVTAIGELLSPRTRQLGLLNSEQERLSTALQLRRDVSLSYWSTVALFGNARWPLEDIPWSTVGGAESDYHTLLVCGLVLQDLPHRRLAEDELSRIGAVLAELAQRGRVNRRMLRDDPALALHIPGVLIRLPGSERLGPEAAVAVSDFAPLLLDQVLIAAGSARTVELRDRLLTLADEAFDHLLSRRFEHGRFARLWDRLDVLAGPSASPAEEARLSWSTTYRVIEALVTGLALVHSTPVRSPELSSYAVDMLNEADHLLSRMMASTPSLNSRLSSHLHELAATLERARELVAERPGTAVALIGQILLQLDINDMARRDAARGE